MNGKTKITKHVLTPEKSSLKTITAEQFLKESQYNLIETNEFLKDPEAEKGEFYIQHLKNKIELLERILRCKEIMNGERNEY